MSDQLLHDDILLWLSDHRGRERARPRADLLAYLRLQGHAIDDRAMRKAYADVDKLGSCAKGIFLIADAEDRRIAGKQLHGRAMSELVRERRIKDAAPAGQISLFEEGI